jgi:MFS family permease
MRGRFLAAGALCLGVALASLALPSVPTTDAWGWLVWGRELLGLELHTDVDGAPSWKPLPVLATTPLALLGDAAPEGWLVLARAAGLAGLPLAYVLAARLAGRAAGVVAASALALSAGWWRGLEHGYCEPFVVAALLGAVLAWLERREAPAFVLTLAASLARPECWPLLVALAAWSWRREPGLRPLLAGGVVAVPLLWVGLDWLSSGRFLNGQKVAGAVIRDMSGLELLGLGAQIPLLPVLVLAVLGGAYAFARRQLPAALIAVLALAATAGLTLAAQLGYPPTERLYFPVAGLVCVLAGVGAVTVVRRAHSPRARAALAAGLAAASLPFAAQRLELMSEQVEVAGEVERLQAGLRLAAREAEPATTPATTVALPRELMWARGVIAWEWDVELARIGELDDPPKGADLLFFVPRPFPSPALQAVASTPGWKVLRSRRTAIRAFGRGKRG